VALPLLLRAELLRPSRDTTASAGPDGSIEHHTTRVPALFLRKYSTRYWKWIYKVPSRALSLWLTSFLPSQQVLSIYSCDSLVFRLSLRILPLFHNHYYSLNLFSMPQNAPEGFEKFDDPSIYAKYETAVRSADTLNFLVDFDSEAAFAALNVDVGFMKRVLNTQVGDSLSERPTTARLKKDPWFLYKYWRLGFSGPHTRKLDGCKLFWRASSLHRGNWRLFRNLWMPEKQKGSVNVSFEVVVRPDQLWFQ